jgi:hypothetical protein
MAAYGMIVLDSFPADDISRTTNMSRRIVCWPDGQTAMLQPGSMSWLYLNCGSNGWHYWMFPSWQTIDDVPGEVLCVTVTRWQVRADDPHSGSL